MGEEEVVLERRRQFAVSSTDGSKGKGKEEEEEREGTVEARKANLPEKGQ